ncbi:MAG TPA: RNA methyltransferase [Rhodothermales bacterium]|nr:RNA methyltransferase [Rhodothermales bacterium]
MNNDREAAERAAHDMRRLLGGTGALSPHDPDSFFIAGRQWNPGRLIEVLRPYLTDARAERIGEVLSGRTYGVVPVLESPANTGNVSAVMRTAEGLGYQGFHVVANTAVYKHSERTARGADKWLDVRRWTSPEDCAAYLREQGYRIVATHLEAAIPIEEIDFTRKTAVVFGNEKEGVSPEMLALADERIVVPMSGFVQSFNISVAAAVVLYHAYRDRMARRGHHGDLTDAECEALRALFYLRSVTSAERILERIGAES